MRAIQAANPDIVAICSYPLDSVGMVRAVNEIGFKPKMIGGAMVGLQATVFKNQLGPLLNGWVNYETWVPAKSMMFEGTEEFFKKYQARAARRRRRSARLLSRRLGLCLHLRCWATPSRATNSLDDNKLADYIKPRPRSRPSTAPIKFGASGEWAKSGMLQVQYHGIKQGAGLETWRGMDYQTVLTPDQYKTGTVIYPYEKAK